jgi:transaldolase
MIKVPATDEGLPAIRTLIGEGIHVNVTLIFAVEMYERVMDAYLEGLARFRESGCPLGLVSSVASFFVSRVDTETDRRLDEIGTDEALALRGKAAVANAQCAYQLFVERFSGPRWQALAARGARVQRPLWASTSTKNPAYPDTLYVDELIGPDTVNTMPDNTLVAVLDHGRIDRTIDADPARARGVLDALAGVGVDLDDVTRTLEEEGVASFSKSFHELLSTLDAKTHTFDR